MKTNNQEAMTLMELLVVVIIIGVLASIIVPNYVRARERAMDKQGNLTVSAIMTGEKNYRLKHGSYYRCVPPGSAFTYDIGAINSNLSLSLDETEWDCYVYTYAPSWPSTMCTNFLAYCSRNHGGYNRYYYYHTFLSGPEEPRCGGNCP